MRGDPSRSGTEIFSGACGCVPGVAVRSAARWGRLRRSRGSAGPGDRVIRFPKMSPELFPARTLLHPPRARARVGFPASGARVFRVFSLRFGAIHNPSLTFDPFHLPVQASRSPRSTRRGRPRAWIPSSSATRGTARRAASSPRLRRKCRARVGVCGVRLGARVCVQPQDGNIARSFFLVFLVNSILG